MTTLAPPPRQSPNASEAAACARVLLDGLLGLGWSTDDAHEVAQALLLPATTDSEARPLSDALAELSALAEHTGDRKARGSYYTAPDVTAYITDSTIIATLVDACPDLARHFDIDAAVTANQNLRAAIGTALARLDPNARVRVRTVLAQLRVLDPTCGAGAFLDTAASLLHWLWQEVDAGPQPGAYPVDRLAGVDLDTQAVLACRCALVLRMAQLTGDQHRTLAAAHTTVTEIRVADATRQLACAPVDCVIGNPPYVRERASEAAVDLRTASCANRYAWVAERALAALREGGRIGLIVPVSSLCADAFEPWRDLWRDCCDRAWASSYDTIPSTLFPGTVQRLAIWLGRAGAAGHEFHVTRYHKWRSDDRPNLFPSLRYTRASPHTVNGSIAKIGTDLERSLLERLFVHGPAGELFAPQGSGHANCFHYKRRWSYFLLFTDFMPDIFDADGVAREPTEFKTVHVVPDLDARALLATYASSLFYWYFTVFSDNRNVNVRDLAAFPFARPEPDVEHDLAELGSELMVALRANSELRTCTYRSIGTIRNRYFFQARTRPVLDRIDAVLARHYDLSGEQLQFVLDHERDFRSADRVVRGER